MRRRSRLRGFAASLLLGATIVVLAPMPVSAAVNELTDGITAGVVRTADGFGTGTVIVPMNGYVTYFAAGAPNLAGTPVEVWTNTGGAWTRVASRSFAADGTLRFFARITGRTSFQARIPGTPGGSAHGRSASTWANAGNGRTRLSVGCDDFATEENASALVARTAGLKSGSQIDVVLCSNPSTGYAWEAVAVDSARLRLVGHHEDAAPSTGGIPIAGASGTETWSFRVVGSGTGHAVLAYSQPFAGGQKAVGIFILTTLV